MRKCTLYLGALALAATALVPQPAHSADLPKCTSLGLALKANQKAQSDAQEHVDAAKPRLEALNKQIDALTIQEADFFVSNGGVNALIERQLDQRRTEYKKALATAKDDAAAVRRAQSTIFQLQTNMRSLGCPEETTAESVAKTQQLDASKMIETSAHHVFKFVVAGDLSSDFLLVQAVADYHWARLYGATKMNGNPVPTQLLLECPVRTSSSGATYSYDCNYDILQFDDVKPKPNIAATSVGRAHLKLTVVSDHRSQLSISFEPSSWHDVTKKPPQDRPWQGPSIALNEERN